MNKNLKKLEVYALIGKEINNSYQQNKQSHITLGKKSAPITSKQTIKV